MLIKQACVAYQHGTSFTAAAIPPNIGYSCVASCRSLLHNHYTRPTNKRVAIDVDSPHMQPNMKSRLLLVVSVVEDWSQTCVTIHHGASLHGPQPTELHCHLLLCGANLQVSHEILGFRIEIGNIWIRTTSQDLGASQVRTFNMH